MKTFGQPGSITPQTFRCDLQPHTIAEGLALLREMGMTRGQIASASGFSLEKIKQHLDVTIKPYLPTSMQNALGREPQ